MKVGRNDPCPCGSGIKFKKCCLMKESLGYALNLKGKKAEEFVHNLAKRAFISDWCYPNPKLPNGKEICDLLIVYDNVAIIWQIKDLMLDETGKYKKSDVEKNLRQISGAKRRLFELTAPIELENPRRGKEKFDSKSITEIHLISALLGTGEDVYPLIETVDGQVVHNFTKEFTDIILTELNTISDFLKYLREKEQMISKNKSITILDGEKGLLGYYLMHERSFVELSTADYAILQEGFWEELIKKPQFIAKKKEDEISYGWDEIINRAHTGKGEYEEIARELARPTRFERRLLSKTFYNAMILANKTPGKQYRRIIPTDGVTYCFMFDDEREGRKEWLGSLCYVARGEHQQNKNVVGIATEKTISPECSYDFCRLYLPEWNEEEQKIMEEIKTKMGIMQAPKTSHFHDDEYSPI